LAGMAHLYLPLRVGSDVALLLGMAHVISRDGFTNHAFITERTKGADEFLEHLKPFTPEWAAEITGLNPSDIEKAARMYGGADRGAIYYTLGITEHICGVDNVQSLCNLALMTGNLGREGTGINPMRGQNNIQGAGDSGAVPANYPGFQPVNDSANQEKFSKLYGREINLEKGITKVTALNECGKSIHAMIINGENTVVSDPDRDHCKRSLESLDHLVLIDIFRTETAELADVVLPATAFGETDGVCVNTERRVQRLRQAVPPQGEARPDWWIVSQIAQRLGIPGFGYESAKDVFNELCGLSAIYTGLDWDRIKNAEYQWPVPEKDHPGTPILHEGEFKNGRGLFSLVKYRDPAEVVNEDYPVWLTTGRRLQAYHTRTQTGRSAGIDYLLSEESLGVHPSDIVKMQLTDGGFANLTSRRGTVKIRVRASDQSPPGTVFCSFSFNDVPVNILTGSGYDPITETAELKVCAVRVEPAED
ncbi:molybdopterin-dependent oxidoreductase, partial [Verrucomicrobia bacterium]|nr:molybdopterin-dependent oxidoreductase [Verrucomicrobiota bacterium]